MEYKEHGIEIAIMIGGKDEMSSLKTMMVDGEVKLSSLETVMVNGEMKCPVLKQ